MIAAPWAAGSGAIDLYVSYRYRFLPFMAHNKCKHRWFMLCGTQKKPRSRLLASRHHTHIHFLLGSC